jgi:hypothetical protein
MKKEGIGTNIFRKVYPCMVILIGSNSGDLKLESRRLSVNLLSGVERLFCVMKTAGMIERINTYSKLKSRSIGWVSKTR